jgi:hypothetical protein
MRLYVVTRQDLTPEVQARQLCRALMKFKSEFPEIGRHWYAKQSRALIAVVPAEDTLRSIWQEVLGKNIRASAVCDSSLQRHFNAVVFEYSPKMRRLLSKLDFSI